MKSRTGRLNQRECSYSRETVSTRSVTFATALGQWPGILPSALILKNFQCLVASPFFFFIVLFLRTRSNMSLFMTGYGSKGERLVAGVVTLSADMTKVLMIQSAGPGGWVLPKGGWETDEDCAQQAAIREAWEEAGVICTIQRDLGWIPDMRPSTLLTSNAPKASYHFFEATVDRVEEQWPEMHKRKRRWATYAEAATALASRPELSEALNRSSLQR